MMAGEISLLFQEYDKAIDNLRNAVTCDPEYANAWNRLGQAYQGKGELEKAISCYEKSLQLIPNQPEIRKNLEALTVR